MDNYPQPASSNATSGLVVHLIPGTPSRSMSVVAFAQGFELAAGKEEILVANTCAYAAPRPLVAFAFRVHAHALGRNVSLESLVGGHNPDPRAEVTTLKTKTLSDGPFQFHAAPVMRASRDSRLPQMFEELSEAAAFALLPGSKVRVTCAFDTTSRDALTRAGWGHDDEMCNLYLMVHAEEPVYLGCVGDARYGAGPHGVAARMTVEHSPKVRLVPIRPHWRGERRSLRTFPVISLRPHLAFNTRPRCLSTPTDAFQLHPDIIFKDARGGGGGGRGGGVAPDPSELRAHVVPPPSRRKSWPREIGQVGGVAVEPDGRHVWVFHRASRVWDAASFVDDEYTMPPGTPPIEEDVVVRVCAVTGDVVASFGAGKHYMPHGISLAPDGHVWVTDVGSHAVSKYDPATGEEVARFGERRREGDDDGGKTRFCAPTDVEVAEDGSFWVTDGYCGDRVARFDANGAFISEFRGGGGGGNETARPKTFSVPHGIALDSANGRLFVADRENARVTEHDLSGALLRAHDLSKHGYVYDVGLIKDESRGMNGFYALCWRRDAAAAAAPVRVAATWEPIGGGGTALTTTSAHWDLPPGAVTHPHALSVFPGAVGGADAWGLGVGVFVGETRPSLGAPSLRRLWIGKAFDAKTNVVAPPRGWNASAVAERAAAAAAAAAKKKKRPLSDDDADDVVEDADAAATWVGSAGAADVDVVETPASSTSTTPTPSSTDRPPTTFDREGRLPAPQHGGSRAAGFGGVVTETTPGGGPGEGRSGWANLLASPPRTAFVSALILGCCYCYAARGKFIAALIGQTYQLLKGTPGESGELVGAAYERQRRGRSRSPSETEMSSRFGDI